MPRASADAFTMAQYSASALDMAGVACRLLQLFTVQPAKRATPPLRLRRVSRSPAQSLSENTFRLEVLAIFQNSYNNTGYFFRYLSTRFTCGQIPAVGWSISGTRRSRPPACQAGQEPGNSPKPQHS